MGISTSRAGGERRRETYIDAPRASWWFRRAATDALARYAGALYSGLYGRGGAHDGSAGWAWKEGSSSSASYLLPIWTDNIIIVAMTMRLAAAAKSDADARAGGRAGGLAGRTDRTRTGGRAGQAGRRYGSRLQRKQQPCGSSPALDLSARYDDRCDYLVVDRCQCYQWLPTTFDSSTT